MRHLIKPLGLAAALTFTGTLMADDSNAAIQKQLEEMKSRMDRQEAELNAMRSATGEQYITREEASRLIQNDMSTLIDERVDAGIAEAQAQHKDTSPMLNLGSGIDSLTIKGDLRLRYQHDDMQTSTTESTRDRYRIRLRVGGVWAAEGWEVGVGLATGSDDPVSTNDTVSESKPFETGDIRLDYAYAAHTWGDLKLTAGQQINPYKSTYVMWDGDARPVGATLQYKAGDFFATGGIYDVRNVGANQSDVYMSAAQVGYKGKYDQLDFMVAAAYYYYTATFNGSVTPTAVDDDYTFNNGDLYAEANYKLDAVKLGVYGEIIQNFSAEGSTGQVAGVSPEDNDLAWIGGFKLGYDKWAFDYSYAHIGADAVYAALTDSDFGAATGSTTDVEGHKLSLTYKVTKNIELGATAFFVEPIKRASTVADASSLYQVDAVWKF